MKNNSISFRAVKAVSALAAVIALFVFNPMTSVAAGTVREKAPKTGTSRLSDEQVTVQYAGATESNVIFDVKLENPNAQKFWVIVKNDAGEVVYQHQYSDTHFSKSFYLPKEESEIQAIVI